MPLIPYPVRINRYLALTGVSTRREGDLLVEKGFVTINGKKAKLGELVNQGDTVEVKGHTEKKYVYFAYYKPREILSHSAQDGEKDIKSVVHKKDVFPIGRLDKDSEGLIILTNGVRITDRL